MMSDMVSCQSDAECGEGRVCFREDHLWHPVNVGWASVTESEPAPSFRCNIETLTCESMADMGIVMGCQGIVARLDSDVTQRRIPVFRWTSAIHVRQTLNVLRGSASMACASMLSASQMSIVEEQECSASFRCVDLLEQCQDGDNDGYGVGSPCLGRDCDDADPNINSMQKTGF